MFSIYIVKVLKEVPQRKQETEKNIDDRLQEEWFLSQQLFVYIRTQVVESYQQLKAH